MSASDPCLRRVVVHADGTTIDLALPATVSVADLIPSIVDLLGDTRHSAARYWLSRLGGSPLPNSTTLAQNDIRDGSVLILSHQPPQPPSRRFDEDAAAVSAALGTAGEHTSGRANRLTGAAAAAGLTALGALLLVRNASGGDQAGAAAAVSAIAGVAALTSGAIADRRFHVTIAGPALGVVAAIFASVTGLLIVPGTPGAPHVLLAAMASAVTAVVGSRIIHCGAVLLMTLAGCAVLIALAALAAVVTGAPTHVVGSVTALACLGLLEAAPRVSIKLAGLSPRLPAELDTDRADSAPAEGELAARAIRADGWLTGLTAVFAAGAGLSAALAAFTTYRAIAFAAVIAGLLVLRAPAEHRRSLILTVSGIVLIAATFTIAVLNTPKHAAWIAMLTALLTAVPMYLGFVAPAMSVSPSARRVVEVVGCLAMAAVVPLGCWTCGAFSAAQGLA